MRFIKLLILTLLLVASHITLAQSFPDIVDSPGVSVTFKVPVIFAYPLGTSPTVFLGYKNTGTPSIGSFDYGIYVDSNNIFRCLGSGSTNCFNGSSIASGTTPSQLMWQWPTGNSLGSSTVLFGPLAFATAVTIPTNGTDSNGFSAFYLGTAPTSTWVMTIYRLPYTGAGTVACSGTPASIGTVSVSTSNIATFSITLTNFASGDCIEYVAPSSVDTTAATPYMTQYLLK